MRRAIKAIASVVMVLGIVTIFVSIPLLGGAEGQATMEGFNEHFLFGAAVLAAGIIATYTASAIARQIDKKETDYDF